MFWSRIFRTRITRARARLPAVCGREVVVLGVDRRHWETRVQWWGGIGVQPLRVTFGPTPTGVFWSPPSGNAWRTLNLTKHVNAHVQERAEGGEGAGELDPGRTGLKGAAGAVSVPTTMGTGTAG